MLLIHDNLDFKKLWHMKSSFNIVTLSNSAQFIHLRLLQQSLYVSGQNLGETVQDEHAGVHCKIIEIDDKQ